MNFFDIFVLFIILFFTIKAYRLGFVLSCLEFLSSFFSIIISYILQDSIISFIKTSILYDNIRISISRFLDMNLLNFDIQYSITEISLPNFLKEILIDNSLVNSNLKEYLVDFISNITISIISFIITFILIKFLIRILFNFFDIISKFPVINFINKFIGIIFGILQSFIFIWIIFIFLTFFSFNSRFKDFFYLLEQSHIASFFYNNNLLIFILLRIFK